MWRTVFCANQLNLNYPLTTNAVITFRRQKLPSWAGRENLKNSRARIKFEKSVIVMPHTIIFIQNVEMHFMKNNLHAYATLTTRNRLKGQYFETFPQAICTHLSNSCLQVFMQICVFEKSVFLGRLLSEHWEFWGDKFPVRLNIIPTGKYFEHWLLLKCQRIVI